MVSHGSPGSFCVLASVCPYSRENHTFFHNCVCVDMRCGDTGPFTENIMGIEMRKTVAHVTLFCVWARQYGDTEPFTEKKYICPGNILSPPPHFVSLYIHELSPLFGHRLCNACERLRPDPLSLGRRQRQGVIVPLRIALLSALVLV